MKTEIVSTHEVKKIDWSIPMVVKHEDSELHLLTNGVYYGNEFTGIVIIKNNLYDVGYKSSDWSIIRFTPINEPITIKFIP